MKIFTKNKFYSFSEIIDICNQNGLITVDCLKDENMISVEKEGTDCLFEFHQVGDEIFKLTWSYA
jgi:5'(3')-deoxyribonucleotidase